MPQDRAKSFYVERAITRKIIRDGSGLRPDKMDDAALWKRLRSSATLVCEYCLQEGISSPQLARSAIDALAIIVELEMRGQQFPLPLDGV